MNPVPRAYLCRSSVDQALGVSCWHGSLRGQVWAAHTKLHAVLPDIISGWSVELYYCAHLSFYLCFHPLLLSSSLALCACACCFVPPSFLLSPPEFGFLSPDRLWRPLGFPFYNPLYPAGSDPRTPPKSIALIPSTLSPRLPSSAPSRGHSVHGRQSSTADRPQLR